MKLGDSLPDISLQATGDQVINLSTIKNQKILVYFYPKDNTPGCTTEGQNFRDSYGEFTSSNCLIFGVSRDSVTSHQRFKDKQSFPFDLLSDPDELLCKAFEVIKLKKLYGKEFLGIERSSFLFDGAGVLVAEWRKVRVKEHVDQILQAVKSLK